MYVTISLDLYFDRCMMGMNTICPTKVDQIREITEMELEICHRIWCNIILYIIFNVVNFWEEVALAVC